MWSRFSARLILASGLFVFSISISQALEQIEFEVEQTEYSGWSVADLKLNLTTENSPVLSITAQQLSPPTGEPFSNLQIYCEFPQLETLTLLECPSGKFSANHKKLGRIEGQLGFSYQADTGEINVDVNKLRLAGGVINFTGKFTQKKWSLDLKARSVRVAKLKKLVTLFVSWPEGISEESGKLNWDASITGYAEVIDSAKIKLRTSNLAFDGRSVAEELDAELNLSVKKTGSAWRVSEALNLQSGVIYIEPGIKFGDNTPGFFLEPGKEGIKQTMQAVWQKETLIVDSFSFSHPEVISVSGTSQLKFGQEKPIEKLNISLATNALENVFQIYLQPLLFGTGLDQTEILGQTDLTINMSEGSITDFHLKMDDVYFDDKDDRFHVAGLNGDVHLNSDPEPALSNMSWRAGSIYKVNIGAGEMKLASKGRSMTLREKMVIPIFDGGLQIDDMTLDNLGLENYSVHIDSQLTPITLSEFTEAMGWPIMAGNVSGKIPGLSYHEGNLSVDGVLNVKVFDGDISIRQLKIEDLFNTVPSLYSDILITNLDLGVLSQTFEFGKITGKLSGYMKNLRMEDWQPVQFDASFFTPKDDDSKHRISQRAIDNITSIGGGGSSNAISRGILGMFEEFPYSKLGLSCVLENNNCLMDGVEQTGDSYYIVKRGFLPPWLEIKGYNRKVNWQELLERLKNISETEGPIVE